LKSLWYPDLWREGTQDQFGETSPPEVLIKRFCPDVQPDERRHVSTLLRSTRAAGIYFMMQINDSGIWAQWRDFLMELERLGKDLGPFSRPTFLIELTGSPILNPLPTGMTVAWHNWTGVVGREDMRAYAAVLAAESREVGHVREVRSAVASELALWDPELIEQLISAPLRQLLSPEDLLMTVARTREWQNEALSLSDDTARISGKLSEINDRTRWHSAALACADHLRDLHMRVWRGQVAALFPFIEDLRLTAAVHMDRVLPKPIELDGTRLDDLRHLEISHLWNLATSPRSRSVLPSDLLEAIGDLRGMRNRLAHLKVVSADDLLSPAVSRLARIHSELPEAGGS